MIAKFYRPDRWSRESLRDEHQFLAELDDAGVPVARPLLGHPDGTIGELGGIFFALFPYVEGVEPPEEADDDLFRAFGRILARLHRVGASGKASARPSMEPESFGLGNLRFLLERNVLPDNLREEYATCAHEIIRRSTSLFRTVPFHRIHADFYAGNCIMGREELRVIDFDDMMTGPAVQDIWMLAKGSGPEAKRRRGIVVEGYRDVEPFDEAWLNLIEPLRALRLVWARAWIAARWFDPIFRREFPRFETSDYWREETDRLKTLLEAFPT
jgi:Ser/Thr protein kinase RdoA (MazF antagonist)